MKDKVYLFGAYFGNKENGEMVLSNYILDFPSMPPIDDIRNTLRKGDKGLESLTILSMQFLTKEQFFALKGVEENPAEQQSELLNKKVTELNLSVRTINICLSNDLNTVRDICRIAKTDWLKFRNGGHKSMSEVDTFLKENGLTWGMNV